MTAMEFQIAQAAQHPVPGGLIGFYGADVADGALTAQFGIATDAGRLRLAIPVGHGSRVGAIGYLEVLDLRVGDEGGREHVLLRFTPDGGGESP